ncbi:MAG: translocation/assembly module TamB domain-containing protein [Chitinophagaceae bacterium]|nr:translocation/assembly module TamB domain-containing protein [Chitinophagaceae bacterium]
MNLRKRNKKLLLVMLKTALWLCISVLLLFASISLLLQIPFVQKKIIEYANERILENTSYSSSIGHVDIDWFDKIHCLDIHIKDTQDSSLIYVKDMFLNFDIIDIIKNKKVVLDNVTLGGAEVRLLLENEYSDVNIYHFVEQIISKFSVDTEIEEKVTEGYEEIPFLIKKINIRDSYFSYHSLSDSLITKGYDYYHFGIKQINGDISHFSFGKDSMVIDIENLSAVDEKEMLRVDDLKTRFVLGEHFMKFDNLVLQTEKSFVSDFVFFEFERVGNMADFVDSVRFRGNFKNSVVHIDELKLFATGLDSVFGKYVFSGNVSGKVGDFIGDMDMFSFGKQSILHGKFAFKGLPDYHTMNMNLQLLPSHILIADIFPYYPIQTPYITKLSHLNFSGNIQLTAEELFVQSVFRSPLGSGNTSFTVDFNKTKSTTYKGRLSLFDFALGKYVGLDSVIHNITLKEDVVFEGSGFDIETLHLKTTIAEVSFLDKKMHNIAVQMDIQSNVFNAIINASDTNIVLNLKAGFEKQKKHLHIKADIKKLPLAFLGIHDTNGYIKTQLIWNTDGTNISEITGQVAFHNTFFTREEKQYSIKKIDIQSFFQKKKRHMEIASDIGYIKADGSFSFDTLIHSVVEDIQQYQYAIANKQWTQSPSLLSVDTLSVQAEIKNGTPLFQFLKIPLIINNKNKLSLQYKKKHFSHIDISFEGDTVQYKDMLFAKSKIQWKSTKETGKFPVLSQIKATIWNYSHQYFQTHNNTLDIIWNNDSITINTLAENETNNKMRLLGSVRLFTDSSVFSIRSLDSTMILGNNIWSFVPNNQIIFYKNNILFQKFEMQSRNQKISILGYLRDSISYPHVSVSNFSLENFYTLQPFHSLVENKIKGIVNGQISFSKKENTHQLHISHEIKNAFVNDSLLGDIHTNSSMRINSDTLYSKITLHKKGKNIISSNGYTVLSDSIAPLHFTTHIQTMPLKISELFLGEYISEVEGTIDGNFSLTGYYTNPILNGNGEITNGKALIQYTQTQYQFSGKYTIDNNKIKSNGMSIRDVFNNRGYLNGYVEIKEYNNLWIDISAKVSNFQVLNTTLKENPFYYGTVYATGDVHFLGNMDEMKLSANAVSNPNTNVHLSMNNNEGEEVASESFIEFVLPKEKKTETSISQKKKQKEESMKLSIELDMEINTNALCEIIFNNSSGDIIKGKGNGKLKLTVNPNEEVSLQGDLEVEEGTYNFTLFNIINKEFSIQKGGKMSWTNDIYKGTMNINAVYQQYASIAPIITIKNTDLLKSPELTRKYPTLLQLNLTGPILQPEMKFDIDIKDYPNQVTVNTTSHPISTEILAFKETIKRDEVELGKQVFSLLVLKSLTATQQTLVNNFSNQYSDVGNATSATISEFFSNQLNYWVSNINPNLEVDVDISSVNADTYKNAQLRLGYSLLDRQLKIVREGSMYDNSQQNPINTAIGNWIIEYKPTQIENMKIKMYYRQNNSDNILNNSNTGRSGFGIQYIKDFDITIPKRKK